MSALIIIQDHMKSFIIIVYVLASVRVGDLNTTPEPMSLNQTKMVVCIGGRVKLPSLSQENCTGKPLLLGPHGKISKTEGRFTKKGDSWQISGVQASDSGQWKIRRYCNNIVTLTVDLEINCQHVLAEAESTLSLKCPKPSIPVGATNIKREMYCKLPRKEAIEVLKDGRVTDKSKEMFGGKRLTVGPDGHSLNISNITTDDAGNYTCLWRWENPSKNLGSRKFTFDMKVIVVVRPPTTPSKFASASSPSTNSSTVTAIAPITSDVQSSVTRDKPSNLILALLLMIFFIVIRT